MTPNGYPTKITVRTEFSDGSSSEQEVASASHGGAGHNFRAMGCVVAVTYTPDLATLGSVTLHLADGTQEFYTVTGTREVAGGEQRLMVSAGVVREPDWPDVLLVNESAPFQPTSEVMRHMASSDPA